MSGNVPTRAIVAALLASLMFASMGVAVRISSAQLPNELIVFLRNSFGLVFLLPWLLQKGLGTLATQRFPAHFFRSVSGLAAMYCFFYAIAHLQLAEAVLLNYSSPLFIAIIAILWFGEEASWKLALAILTGFIGVCLVLKPGAGLFQGAAMVGLLSALFAAFAMVTIRDLSKTEPTHRIVFYFSLISTLISAVPLLWVYQFPGLQLLVLMAFAGLAATLGQLCLTYCYSLAPASQVGPYTYSSVIFAAMYGWMFWEETPDVLTFTGAILVITACTISIKRKKLARE
ncbi:MAG: DMT family transporter [Gammaproteobacteria bacterium]|nr:DMT family transporter [Gammaproteobacteria bacterium]